MIGASGRSPVPKPGVGSGATAVYFLPQSSTSDDGVQTATEHRCLVCGYDLRGLGDGPRCPECGLLNIPEGFRAQVWEVVDSGTWFFSGMFHPLRKRPPGWWWALDREDDVKRSLRFLLKNVCIATLATLTSAVLAGGLMLERTHHYTCFDINDPCGQPVYETDWIESFGNLGGRNPGWGSGEQPDWSQLYARDRTFSESLSSRVVFAPSWYSLFLGALLSIWICLVWACPGLVGLWTQLRKGLPKFALARRTVVSAVNYESHRMIYVSLFVIGGLSANLVIRLQGMTYSAPVGYAGACTLIVVAVVALAAAGWIAPLRSDFTKQLIRSRLHMLRILLMYAALLPFFFSFAVGILLLDVLWNPW